MQAFSEITLTGEAVRLEPLRPEHADALVAAGRDGELFRSTVTLIPTRESIDAYIDVALGMAADGSGSPFVIVDPRSSKIIGSTRYCRADRANRQLEIGYTFIAGSYQRTRVNTEMKYLMLQHAFESLGANRIELRTHVRNQQSRQAILRLGASEEGVLRQHVLMPDGHWRDTVVFSILAGEWPLVKAGLRRKLDGVER
ncbi:MAG: GNAT family protein [Gammaproteobacteria bacterium]|nr:GNAT family protein [Gammaproteobacteria bacterium]